MVQQDNEHNILACIFSSLAVSLSLSWNCSVDISCTEQ